MMLEQERRRAAEEAARLEAERQAALLAKEELARHAEDQKKSQEQLVGILLKPTSRSITVQNERQQRLLRGFSSRRLPSGPGTCIQPCLATVAPHKPLCSVQRCHTP